MEKKVIELIADKLGKKPSTITLKTDLVKDLGADSLDVVELVMAFEDEFGISLPDEQVANMHTVGDVIAYIKTIKK